MLPRHWHVCYDALCRYDHFYAPDPVHLGGCATLIVDGGYFVAGTDKIIAGPLVDAGADADTPHSQGPDEVRDADAGVRTRRHRALDGTDNLLMRATRYVQQRHQVRHYYEMAESQRDCANETACGTEDRDWKCLHTATPLARFDASCATRIALVCLCAEGIVPPNGIALSPGAECNALVDCVAAEVINHRTWWPLKPDGPHGPSSTKFIYDLACIHGVHFHDRCGPS